MAFLHSGIILLFANCICFKLSKKDSEYLGSSDVKVTATYPSRDRRSETFFYVFPADINMHLLINKSDVTMQLHRNDRIVSDVPIYLMKDDTIEKQQSSPKKNIAFYQDSLCGAAVELECLSIKDKGCRYLVRGSFTFQNRFIVVEPEDEKHPTKSLRRMPNDSLDYTVDVKTESVDGTENSIQHRLYDFNDSIEYVSDYIEPDREETFEESRQLLDGNYIATEHEREKRAVVQQQVEFLPVTDYPIYQTWYDDSTAATAGEKRSDALDTIREFYALMLNAIDLRYQSIVSSTIAIEIVYAGIFIADSSSVSTWTESNKTTASPLDQVDSSAALNNFKTWLSNRTDLPDYDHAMAFTGYDLTSGGSTSNAGLAWVGGTCDHSAPYTNSISEDHFEASTGTVAAHELSHNLGAKHDGDGNSCSADDKYVMSPSSGGVTDSRAVNQWIFSSCSVDYMNAYIDQLNADGNNCMLTTGSTYNATALDQYDDARLGQIYDADTQCEKIKGNGSYVCRSKYTDYADICAVMWCKNTDDSTCGTTVAWEGTTCGNKKWCVSGECVSDNRAPNASDTCAFGDQPGVITGSITCATMASPNCYGTGWPQTCCGSCESYYTGTAGCEYGDQASGCIVNSCSAYTANTVNNQCCGTCAAFTTTEAPDTNTSTTTTQAATTTQAPGTTTTAASQGQGTATNDSDSAPQTDQSDEDETVDEFVVAAIVGAVVFATVFTTATVGVIVAKVKASQNAIGPVKRVTVRPLRV